MSNLVSYRYLFYSMHYGISCLLSGISCLLSAKKNLNKLYIVFHISAMVFDLQKTLCKQSLFVISGLLVAAYCYIHLYVALDRKALKSVEFLVGYLWEE